MRERGSDFQGLNLEIDQKSLIDKGFPPSPIDLSNSVVKRTLHTVSWVRRRISTAFRPGWECR
ncbi:hypothetical protein BGLA2_470030 [Burkholderia gladioli]|nr:hypothetical protein BGLA2_470030 [Burkholderia gladioli]